MKNSNAKIVDSLMNKNVDTISDNHPSIIPPVSKDKQKQKFCNLDMILKSINLFDY